MAMPIRIGACEPDAISCSDWPVHSKAKPCGRSPASRSISAIASPLEKPGAAEPVIRAEG